MFRKRVLKKTDCTRLDERGKQAKKYCESFFTRGGGMLNYIYIIKKYEESGNIADKPYKILYMISLSLSAAISFQAESNATGER
jgi:hypothetical protein